MVKILVVEDLPTTREFIADGLQSHGYKVTCVNNGGEALIWLGLNTPQLIILDLKMPSMDGLTMLQEMRKHPRWCKYPVIILTCAADRTSVVKATALGVNAYLLKTEFTLDILLECVKRELNECELAGAAKHGRPEGVLRGAKGTSELGSGIVSAPQLYDRQTTIDRVKSLARLRAPSGLVNEILELAATSSTDATLLAKRISLDAVLVSRVLNAANSAALGGKRSQICDLSEAVGRIGLTGLYQLVSEVMIFDTFGMADNKNNHIIRCWEHLLATGQLMRRLSLATGNLSQELAHLVGLCHDIVELIVRCEFEEEYGRVFEYMSQTEATLVEAEQSTFGISYIELTPIILPLLSLPSVLATPILEHAKHHLRGDGERGRGAATLLDIADAYADALDLGLASSSRVRPFFTTELSSTTELQKLQALHTDQIPAQVSSAVQIILGAVTAESISPDVTKPKRPVTIWYSKHPALSDIDPLFAALDSLSSARIHHALPATPEQLESYSAIVITLPNGTAGKADAPRIEALQRLMEVNPLPVLILGDAEQFEGLSHPQLHYAQCPVPMRTLEQFIDSVS